MTERDTMLTNVLAIIFIILLAYSVGITLGYTNLFWRAYECTDYRYPDKDKWEMFTPFCSEYTVTTFGLKREGVKVDDN